MEWRLSLPCLKSVEWKFKIGMRDGMFMWKLGNVNTPSLDPWIDYMYNVNIVMQCSKDGTNM